MSIHTYTRACALELFSENLYGIGEEGPTARARIQNFKDSIQDQTAAQILYISYRQLDARDFRTLVYRLVAEIRSASNAAATDETAQN